MDERDFIDLNTYLDGEMTAQVQERFEQRLRTDPDLQAELQSLQTTKSLLGMAERPRAPRNFTLDPAVYARPQSTPIWQRLGLAKLPVIASAGAMAVVAFICVGILAFGSVGFAPAGSRVAVEADEQLFAQGAYGDADLEFTEELESEPVEEVGSAGEGEGAIMAPAPDWDDAPPAAEGTQEPATDQGDTLEEPSEGDGLQSTPTSAPQPTIAPSPDQSGDPGSAGDTGGETNELPTRESGIAEAGPGPADTTTDDAAADAAPRAIEQRPTIPLRVVAIAGGLVVFTLSILTAVAGLVLRRRMNG